MSNSARLSPFVGREKLFVRLHQHILNPASQQALLIIGRDGIGKTRLLQHFNTIFGDTHPGVVFGLQQIPTNDTTSFLRHLAEETTNHITKKYYTPIQLPTPPTNVTDEAMQQWFQTTYFEALAQIARSDRHLIWLFDDADALFDTSANLPAYLHALLQTYPFLTIILTINLVHEARLPDLAPLIDVTQVIRLTSFSQEETETVLRAYVGDLPDATIPAIQQATGGHPRFVKSFGRELAKLHNISGDVVRQVLPDVAAQNAIHLEALWRKLERDDRLVLNAISSLYYDDPLQPITAEQIEAWLLETDHPMDITAIRVTLRSLDYQEIITTRHNNIRLTTDLLQKWLLENARLDDITTRSSAVRWYWILIALVGLGIMVAILLNQPIPTITENDILPTVTLANN